jgi:peroxiredoxin family protein
MDKHTVKEIEIMSKVVFFTGNIKLVNDGYNNKIIDLSNNGLLDEITDTLEGAIQFVIKTYGTNVK